MRKIIRVFEIAFLVMMVLSIVEAIRLYTLGETNMALLFMGFAVLAFIMNRVRRKQRQRLEEAENNK